MPSPTNRKITPPPICNEPLRGSVRKADQTGGGVKAILFDLGKVIVDFDFEPAFRRLSKKCPFAPGDIRGYFLNSGLEVLYDGGKISSLDFHKEVKRSLKHELDFKGFKKIWNGVFKANTRVVNLIRRLSRHYRVVLISNTNPMHYDYLRARYNIFDYFDQIILSYQEKIRKPDERIYRKAAKACRAKPSEIFYIDDRQDLTQAAKALGFKTFTFKNNPGQLIKTMAQHRILHIP